MIAAILVAAAITAHAPATVPIDDWFPVHGHAVVEHGRRTVLLQERAVTGEWYRVATVRTRATGWYRFSVPSGNRLRERTLRVVAPPAHGLPRAHTTPFEVDIVMRMAGSARDQQSRGG